MKRYEKSHYKRFLYFSSKSCVFASSAAVTLHIGNEDEVEHDISSSLRNSWQLQKKIVKILRHSSFRESKTLCNERTAGRVLSRRSFIESTFSERSRESGRLIV